MPCAGRQLLARLARHEAPIASLPLDFLCALLHQSLRAAVPSGPPGERRHSDVIYMRMTRAAGVREGGHLVRTETVKLFNAEGLVTQARWLASHDNIHACTHTNTHTHTHTHTHINTHTHTRVFVKHTYTHLCVCLRACVRVRVSIGLHATAPSEPCRPL